MNNTDTLQFLVGKDLVPWAHVEGLLSPIERSGLLGSVYGLKQQKSLSEQHVVVLSIEDLAPKVQHCVRVALKYPPLPTGKNRPLDDQRTEMLATFSDGFSIVRNTTNGLFAVVYPVGLSAGTATGQILAGAAAAQGVFAMVLGGNLYLKQREVLESAKQCGDKAGQILAHAMGKGVGGGLFGIGAGFSVSAITTYIQGNGAAVAAKVSAIAMKVLFIAGYVTFAVLGILGIYRLWVSRQFQKELKEQLTDCPNAEDCKKTLKWLKSQVTLTQSEEAKARAKGGDEAVGKATKVKEAQFERCAGREALRALLAYVPSAEEIDKITSNEELEALIEEIVPLVQKENLEQKAIGALFIATAIIGILAMAAGMVFLTGPLSPFLFVAVAVLFLPIDNESIQQSYLDFVQKWFGPEEIVFEREIPEEIREKLQAEVAALFAGKGTEVA